jgi:glutathione S-transferase
LRSVTDIGVYQLSFANSWVQYGKCYIPYTFSCGDILRILTTPGVFTNRAILSYNGPYNGLGNNQKWPQSKLDVFLEEGAIRGNQSLKILEQRLESNEWLVLGRPTIADISVFVYIALAPMGDISLEPYKAVRAWIERIKKLKGFFAIEGLDDPLIRKR